MRSFHTHSFLRIFFWFYLPALLWLGVIWFFSAQEGLVSRGNPSFLFLLERKGAHVFEFFVLTILIWRIVSLWTKNIIDRVLFTLMLVLWSATLDEGHQMFVAGREGKFSDVLIDMIGAICGVGVMGMLSRKNKRRAKK